MKTASPETSIVIRAFNEERWLPEVFSALHKSRYRDFEVILVDSGSVDRTREIAAANGARIIRLRSEDFTFGHSLNVGIEQAHGSFIAIISAHAIPADEHWLEKLVAPLHRPEVAMVYGGQRGHEISKFSEICDFIRVFPPDSRSPEPDNPFANNANSAVKRELWKSHAFDEGLPGLEDIEWAKYWTERGSEVVYAPDACIIHVHTESWPQVRHRYYREGMAARWVGIKILRHIPGEIWREIRWCLHDLWLAMRQGRALSLLGEILRFRFEKTRGTIGGIADSRGMSNPARRAEIYFHGAFPALVIKGPNRVRLEEHRVPSLKPGEVLVRVSHVGICGTDLEIIEGKLGYYSNGMAEYPIVPGHESSGTVVALGPRVTEFTEGDRIVVECIQGCGECVRCRNDEALRCEERREVGVLGQNGACSAYFVTRARYAHRIPKDVSLAEAALAEPLAVVLKGLRRLGSSAPADAEQPRQCAVIGAGTIGQLAARVLRARGNSVTVFDRDAQRLSTLNSGISTSRTLEDLDRFEWFVEATGSQSLLSGLLDRTPTGAIVLLLGLPYSSQLFSFESVVAYDRSIIGSVGSTAADFEAALETLKLIDTSPFLGNSYRLEDYEAALKAARSRTALKVMFNLNATTA